MIGALEAERGTSASLDLTRQLGRGLDHRDVLRLARGRPVAVERETDYTLFNRDEASTNVGMELLATLRAGDYVATGYLHLRAIPRDGHRWPPGRAADASPQRRDSSACGSRPRARDAWASRCYYTGVQRLEANPYRTESRPYVVIGLLAERRFGRFRLFINAENLD